MGCDIHLYVEVRKDGRWARHDWEDEYRNPPDEDGYRDLKSGAVDAYFDHPLYLGRNYDLFAILADVRNGRGFAGVKTGEGFNPIAEPRGLPDDVTEPIKKESELWGEDGHSHSHFTLRELDAYDWDQKTRHEGWVDPWNFDRWRKHGKPQSWCGAVSGQSIKHISNREMARLLDEGEIHWEGPETEGNGLSGRLYSTSLQRAMKDWPLKPGTVGNSIRSETMPRHYTLVEWAESYRASTKHFHEKTLPALRALGTPDDVRIVFWFDN